MRVTHVGNRHAGPLSHVQSAFRLFRVPPGVQKSDCFTSFTSVPVFNTREPPRGLGRKVTSGVFQVNLTFSVLMTDDLTWTKKNDIMNNLTTGVIK